MLFTYVARHYDQKSFASSHHIINKLRVKLATGRDASLVQGDMNGRIYMILILDKNISQYMQGSALHKHRTLYIAISPCMNTLDHGEILFWNALIISVSCYLCGIWCWVVELSTFGHKPYTTDGGLCRDIHPSVLVVSWVSRLLSSFMSDHKPTYKYGTFILFWTHTRRTAL
jgi:hypothetical protein